MPFSKGVIYYAESGHSAVGSALALGARSREFESRCPDHFFCSLQSSIFAASYLLIFVILRMEDLALMSGTIVLAIILGVLMILTGKINRKEDSIR